MERGYKGFNLHRDIKTTGPAQRAYLQGVAQLVPPPPGLGCAGVHISFSARTEKAQKALRDCEDTTNDQVCMQWMHSLLNTSGGDSLDYKGPS